MTQSLNLTKGSIGKQIIKLSLPVIGTSFIQMAYNMIDMMWLGRIGSEAVAAVGTATFFTWLGISLLLTTRTGAEVGVAQALGAKNSERARQVASHAVLIAFALSITYGAITCWIAPDLIGFFRLKSAYVNSTAISYLRIISLGGLFFYSNSTFSGIFNGAGNSTLPFQLNAAGLLLNIILDPLLIFGIGNIGGLGADGAAIASVFSQAIVFILLSRELRKDSPLWKRIELFIRPKWDIIKSILKLGAPVAIHSILFAIFAMILARIIGKWGALPIAIQSVGAQIEALSWMSAGGFATALSAFTGQNFGANQWNRIRKGYLYTLLFSGAIGILVTILFVFFGRFVFTLFIPEPDAIILGTTYLFILGLSQIFMCVEIATSGGFNGIGRTIPPSLVGILFTGGRIPLALILSAPTLLDMEGVWWSISISSIIKGIVLFGWFMLILYQKPSHGGIKRAFIRLLPTRIRQQTIDQKTDKF